MHAQGDLDMARHHGLQALHYMGAPLPSEEPEQAQFFAGCLFLVRRLGLSLHDISRTQQKLPPEGLLLTALSILAVRQQSPSQMGLQGRLPLTGRAYKANFPLQTWSMA